MKELAFLLLALLIVPASLAAEDVAVPAVESTDQLLPAESCAAESSEPVNAVASENVAAALKVETSSLFCEEICNCRTLKTPPVTRVAATCLRARQRAAAAARELAVCPSSSTGPCGSTTHSVDPCVPIPNGFSATAVATYHCEFCRNKCY